MQWRAMARRKVVDSLGEFQRSLLAWYRCNRRDLPWRRSRDPYRIWVSEVMLQQTRVATVLPFYERFFRVFPTLASLADARTERLLRVWSGLGYYSRARNLQLAARVVIENHEGRFPRELDAALSLPGVGRYMANAVLSIAYEQPLAVLDGNVARVIARREAIRGDLRQPPRWKQLQSIADRWLATESPGDWNQAMMELGATVCTPRQPACLSCPVQSGCRAFQLGLAEQIPERRAKPASRRVRVAAAVIVDRLGRTLLVRPHKSALGSNANRPTQTDDLAPIFSRMWQFPALIVDADSASLLPDKLSKRLGRYLATEFGLRAGSREGLPKLRHTVTVRNITIEPWLIQIEKFPAAVSGRTVLLNRVPAMAISNASRKIALAAIAAHREGISLP